MDHVQCVAKDGFMEMLMDIHSTQENPATLFVRVGVVSTRIDQMIHANLINVHG